MAQPPFLMFDSIFGKSSVTVSASSEAAGYPAANVADWRWDDRWRAGGTSSPAWVKADLGASSTSDADTLIIAGHNLATCGASAVTLECSSDGSSWSTVDALDPRTWKDEHPITLLLGSPGEFRYWRVSISGTLTKAPEIGILCVGLRLEVARLSPEWDLYGEDCDTEWNANVGGKMLGANLNAVSKAITLSLGAPGYIDDEFWKKTPGPNWDDDFVAHSRSKPFWFVPFIEREPYHVWLSRRNGPIASAFVNIVSRRTATLPMICFVPVTP